MRIRLLFSSVDNEAVVGFRWGKTQTPFIRNYLFHLSIFFSVILSFSNQPESSSLSTAAYSRYALPPLFGSNIMFCKWRWSILSINPITGSMTPTEVMGGRWWWKWCILGGYKMRTLPASRNRRQQGGAFLPANRIVDRMRWAGLRRTFPLHKWTKHCAAARNAHVGTS